MPEYLSKYAGDDYLKIGALFEPDYEAVAAAAPDLIIVAGRSSAACPELAMIAPAIDFANDRADFGGSIKENSRILGEIFEKEAEVEAMIGELDEKIAAVQAAAADAGTGLVHVDPVRSCIVNGCLPHRADRPGGDGTRSGLTDLPAPLLKFLAAALEWTRIRQGGRLLAAGRSRFLRRARALSVARPALQPGSTKGRSVSPVCSPARVIRACTWPR